MATSRSSKSKSSGLRILWIPGRRKHNPKGHLDSTSKHVNYNTSPQKKNQLWSLGGSKTQKDLLEAEPDASLFEGPSVSGLSPLAAACTIGAAASSATTKQKDSQTETNIPALDAPPTPNSSTSTALLVSIPNSPEPPIVTTVTSTNETSEMPATKYSSPPITTTVAEVIEVGNNRFAILNQNGGDDMDAFDLPTPPKNDPNWRDSIRINTSADTTSSVTTIVSSVSPNSETKSNENSSTTSSPIKKKSRNHLSNQADVNSIESVSDTDQVAKLDLEWIDDLVLEHNANELLRKGSKHKKKKQHISAKELDQLDGVPGKIKSSTKTDPENVEEDDKLVKCLYYTLMCCECSIS